MGDIKDGHRTLRIVGELGCTAVEEHLVRIVHNVHGTVTRARQGSTDALLNVAHAG